MSDKYEDENNEKEVKTGDVEVMDLIPLLAMCCCILSCFLEFPDCFGAVCRNTFGCCSYNVMTCKASKEDDSCCRLISCDCDIVPCRICCKVIRNEEHFLSLISTINTRCTFNSDVCTLFPV